MDVKKVGEECSVNNVYKIILYIIFNICVNFNRFLLFLVYINNKKNDKKISNFFFSCLVLVDVSLL